MINDSFMVFVYTISGSIIGAITTIVVTIINKRYETKRNLNELIVRTAIENWKGNIEVLKSIKKGDLYPLEAFFISTAVLFQKIDYKKMTETHLIKVLKEVEEINKIVCNQIKKNQVRT